MYLAPQKTIEHFQKCRLSRYNHESVWQRIGEFIVPLKQDILNTSSPGEPKFEQILDSTGMVSCELLAGALHGMLTSPTSFFFYLTTGDPAKDKQDRARKWIQSTVRRMHDQLNNTNFQTEVHEYYIDLCGFGNGSLFIEEDLRDVVRFSCRPLKEVFVKENSKGRIDTMYRIFKLNAKGLVEEYGLQNLPQKMQDAYKNGKHEEYEVLQSIYPRAVAEAQYDPKDMEMQKSLQNMPQVKFPFISQHVLMQEKLNLGVGGYREFPNIFGRWSKIAGEDYGRGPGEKALPDVLTINEMTRVTLVGAQKVIDPPLQMPDDGFVMPLVTRSGGINYYRAGSPATDRVAPMFNDSRVDFGYQAIDRKTAAIKEAFYVNQLQLRDGPQMTATEVQQRMEQSLRFLAPMLGRQQSEFLAPLIERVYGIMSRRNMFEAVPPELNGVPLKVRYSSVIAMTQRQSEMVNIQRGLQALAPLLAMDQTVADVVDATATSLHILNLNNYPQEGIRDQDSIDNIRQQRQQSQDQARQLAQDNQTAETMSRVNQATPQQIA